MLASNAIAGLIWDHLGGEYPFDVDALICMFSLVLLFLEIIKVTLPLISPNIRHEKKDGPSELFQACLYLIFRGLIKRK
jgi:hypothetical protein